jgi:hypothetical protein
MDRWSRMVVADRIREMRLEADAYRLVAGPQTVGSDASTRTSRGALLRRMGLRARRPVSAATLTPPRGAG